MTITADQIADKLTKHVETVSPGLPTHLTAAHQPGDGVWQGDLGLKIIDTIPDGYEKVENPKDIDRQLVPLGGGPGSHHRLQSFDGVTLYRPKNWGKSETDLRGPVLVFSKAGAIVHEPGTKHPHGTVFIDDPMTVECVYQRNWSAELREARRAAD